MKAIIITYDGAEITGPILDKMITPLGIISPKNVSVVQLTDKEVAKALLNVEHIANTVTPSDQEAIDSASTYIAEKILIHFNNPAAIAYAIGRHISCGDEEMRTAVEILATKKGIIKEPKLTKPILNTIKSIYAGIKQIG